MKRKFLVFLIGYLNLANGQSAAPTTQQRQADPTVVEQLNSKYWHQGQRTSGVTTELVNYGSDDVYIRGVSNASPNTNPNSRLRFTNKGEAQFYLANSQDKVFSFVNPLGNRPGFAFLVNTPNPQSYVSASPSMELNKDGSVTFYGSIWGPSPTPEIRPSSTWASNNTNKIMTLEGDNYSTGWMSHVTIGDKKPNTATNYRLAVDGKAVIGNNVAGNHGDYMLSVDGKIVCKKWVTTQVSWADSVFSSSHMLPSLDSVEHFIKAHKHLPGVRSQQEVLQNGLDGSDMLKDQMAKIEELYLYTIRLNKKLQESEKRNVELEYQLERLEAQTKRVEMLLKVK